MMNILLKLQDALYEGRKNDVEMLTREALLGGIDPLMIIEDGLRAGLSRVGDDYEVGEIFLPELVSAGEAALGISKLVEEVLGEGKAHLKKGTFAIGSAKGDIHSIGKSMVTTMMRVNGFNVIDLGVDVSPGEFLEVADKVDAVGISSLISISTRSMEETIQKLSKYYPEVVVIIGGAAVDPALAKAFGVLYGADAASTPRIVEEKLSERKTE